MSKMKRPDIQGIRGLAIASVLAFHLREQQFPAGFVGVDIFFVLSGFLMSSILAREHAITLVVLKTFYIRRFKRIVPLYSILLIILFFSVPIILMKRDVTKFIVDVVWATFFSTNIHSVVEQTDYFTELFDSNVLTHTWSLGVEIQYYLIVPFIYSIQRLVGSTLSFPYLVLLIIASFSFQLFTSPNVSFNLLLSRVWQFLGGAIAYEIISWQTGDKILQTLQASGKTYSAGPTSDVVPLLEKDEDVNIKDLSLEIDGDDDNNIMKNSDTWKWREWLIRFLSITLVITMIIFALSPVQLLPSPYLRLFAIALTATVIVIGNNEANQSIIFSNRFIVYLGDISYVVYLAHWPVIIMWKSYWDLTELSEKDIFICLSVTFVISVAIHHSLEKFFITASTKVAVIVVSIIYIVIFSGIALHIPQNINKAITSGEAPLDIAEAIKWNERETHSHYYNAPPFTECVDDREGQRMAGGYHEKPPYECIYKPNNTNGYVDILVLGSSISHRATKVLYDILKDYSELRTMRLFAQSACRPLESNCKDYFAAAENLIKASHPDITITIYDDSEKLRAPIENITNDSALQAFERYLTLLSENSKFVVLDEFYPLPSTSVGIAVSMYKRLLRNQSLTDLKGQYQSFLDSYDNYFKRLDAIHIENLRRHNTSGPLCAEQPGWCWWYNRHNLHAYFTDNKHLSMEGLMLERQSYKAILDDLIPKIRAEKRIDS